MRRPANPPRGVWGPVVTSVLSELDAGLGEQIVLQMAHARQRRPQQRAETLFPFFDVEMMFVLQRPAQHGREFVKRFQQLGGGGPQRFRLPARARAHVGEDRLLGARGDDGLRAALDIYIGAFPGAPLVVDRHQTDDLVGAPELAVAEKHHPLWLDVHVTAFSSRAVAGCRPTPPGRSYRPCARARRNSPST